MKKYKFEIDNLIKVTINANDKEEARQKIINNLEDYKDDLINDCVVSDGEEVEE